MRREINERTILFLCEDNACLSQMAEAAAKHLSPPKTRIFSAGVRPAVISAQAIEAMRELGINMSGQKSKGLSDIPLDEIDLIVSFGDADKQCRELPRRAKIARWAIARLERDEAPGGGASTPLPGLRACRDEIDKRVFALFLDHWRNTPKSN